MPREIIDKIIEKEIVPQKYIFNFRWNRDSCRNRYQFSLQRIVYDVSCCRLFRKILRSSKNLNNNRDAVIFTGSIQKNQIIFLFHYSVPLQYLT